MRIPTSLKGRIVIRVMNKAIPPHTITSEGRFPRTNQHFFTLTMRVAKKSEMMYRGEFVRYVTF